MDYWIREGDECLSADTDYACSLGMAFAVLEDVRLNANQRDVIAMFRDHLRDLETEMQRQIREMRDHILGRYRRSLQG